MLALDMPAIEQQITAEFIQSFKAQAQSQPVLILIGGYVGAGKSSLIERMQKIYDFNVIATDAIRHRLFSRGVKSSPEFGTHVENIYRNLMIHALNQRTHIVVDANAHTKRIAEIGKLLSEQAAQYRVVKIFLKASKEVLVQRVQARKPKEGFYQGTVANLEGVLKTATIKPEEYDLVVETDQMPEDAVFERVNQFIAPYLRATAKQVWLVGGVLIAVLAVLLLRNKK